MEAASTDAHSVALHGRRRRHRWWQRRSQPAGAGGALPAPGYQDEADRRGRWTGLKWVRMVSKLDESKAQWIVRHRRNGAPAAQVAEAMNVSKQRVGKLVKRYKGCEIGYIVSLSRWVGPGAACRGT